MNNCKFNNNVDECGCQTSCPSYDCHNVGCQSDSDCHSNEFCRPTGYRSDIPMVNGRRLQLPSSECVEKVGINETCGGYTPPEISNKMYGWIRMCSNYGTNDCRCPWSM